MRVELSPPIRVALVDDHPVVRQAISHLLQGAGFHICMTAGNGRLFLDALESGAEPPDVCLLDVNMPVMDGFQTTLALRERWPAIKVLAASFNNEPAIMLEMLHCGAVGYLLKDSEPDEWKEAIVAAHRHGYYFDQRISFIILECLRAVRR